MSRRMPRQVSRFLAPLSLTHKLAAYRRGWALTWPARKAQLQEFWQARQREQRPWRILEIHDLSMGLAKRLDVLVLVPEGLSRGEIAPMLAEATAHVREKRHRTAETPGFKRRYRKRMAKRRPAYVWLQAFTKEKRPTDLWSNRDAPFFVCRTEWFDPAYAAHGLQPILGLPERVEATDITVEWSPRYP